MTFGKRFEANFRIYHGGKFVTKKRQTEYVGGILYLVGEVFGEGVNKVVGTVKNAIKSDNVGVLWYRRPGLSLFAGRKKNLNDMDVQYLMATKDNCGLVDIYAVREKRVVDGSKDELDHDVLLSDGDFDNDEDDDDLFADFVDGDVSDSVNRDFRHQGEAEGQAEGEGGDQAEGEGGG
ncbi:hypothetical protein vseg_010829 [Gypsophila vaccaria]